MDKKAIVEKLNVRNYYVSELPSLKANGSKAMALCPFHDDTNPSLSIDLGTGRFNCFGCGRQGSIIDFYITKHGVSFNEAKKILIEQGILLTPQKVITQTYNYVDESGTLLFQVVRYSPKEFRQRRPDGEGGWFWNLKDTRKILYNLPEVIKTKSVVICEGEKDVEFLKNLGLPATCNPMGAGKWRDEYNDHFIDKYVAVVMDCDPPGRDHGEKVARSVHSCAKSVKLIDLGKLPYIKFSNEAWNSGEDLEDFWKAFVAYHGKENLKLFRKLILTIIASTTPYCPSSLLDQLMRWDDVLTLDIKTMWLLEGLIPAGSIILLFGRGGIGKTWLALQISRAIAEGLPFGNLQTKKVPVYYVDFENPLAVLKERVGKIGKAQNLYIWHLSNEIPPPRLDGPKWRRYQELPPGLLIFDTLRAAHLSDENDSQPMAGIMQKLKELREMGFTILLLHHTPKGNENIFKGSTALLDLADHVLGIEEVKDSENVEFNTDNLYRLGVRIKTRYEPSHVFLRFNPESGFEIIQDPDIKRMESICEILRVFDFPPNQSKLTEKVKEELDYPKGQISRLLKKGAGIYWDIGKGPKNSCIYILKDSDSQFSSTIYTWETEKQTFTAAESLRNREGSDATQPFDNTKFASLPGGVCQAENQNLNGIPQVLDETEIFNLLNGKDLVGSEDKK